MTANTLEERVTLLEQEVGQLRRDIHLLPDVPWWEQITGVFADIPEFDEATALGRQYRDEQHPQVGGQSDVST